MLQLLLSNASTGNTTNLQNFLLHVIDLSCVYSTKFDESQVPYPQGVDGFYSSSLDTHSSSISVFVAYCHYRGREHATSLPFFLTHIFLSTQTQDAKNFFPHASATTSISTNAPFFASAPICHPATMSARRLSIGRSQGAEGKFYLHTSTHGIKADPPTLPRSHRLRETA
jgi:hypothetical protein